MSDWISVKDRLPPVCNILDEPLESEGRKIAPLYVSVKVIMHNRNGDISVGSVEWFREDAYINCTHWMPLPDCPKENKKPRTTEEANRQAHDKQVSQNGYGY